MLPKDEINPENNQSERAEEIPENQQSAGSCDAPLKGRSDQETDSAETTQDSPIPQRGRNHDEWPSVSWP